MKINNTMRKILSIYLALIMIITITQGSVFAWNEYSGEDTSVETEVHEDAEGAGENDANGGFGACIVGIQFTEKDYYIKSQDSYITYGDPSSGTIRPLSAGGLPLNKRKASEQEPAALCAFHFREGFMGVRDGPIQAKRRYFNTQGSAGGLYAISILYNIDNNIEKDIGRTCL